MTTPKYLLLFLMMMTASEGCAQEKRKTYVVQSAYTTAYLKGKKSFEPYKQIKTSKNGWLITFSHQTITFKKERLTQVYTIVKYEEKYQNTLSYAVRNPQGHTSIIEFNSTKGDTYVSLNIDVFDFNNDGSYQSVTKYVVKQQ